jgi:hypothetical protein
MKLIGMNKPRKKKKDDSVSRLKAVSLKGSTKTLSLKARGLRGSRALTVAMATPRRARRRKAIVRIVHAKPISGIKCEAMMGMMMPPRPLPAAMTP